MNPPLRLHAPNCGCPRCRHIRGATRRHTRERDFVVGCAFVAVLAALAIPLRSILVSMGAW